MITAREVIMLLIPTIAIALLFSGKIRNKFLRRPLYDHPQIFFLLPIALFCYYLAYYWANGAKPVLWPHVLTYFLGASIILLPKYQHDNLNIQNIAAIVWFTVLLGPLHWVSSVWTRKQGDVPNQPLVAELGSILAVVLWTCWQRNHGIKLRYPAKKEWKKGILFVGGSLLLMFPLLLYPAFLIHFIDRINPKLPGSVLEIIAGNIALGSIEVFFFTAFGEELLFRGRVQCLLDKAIKNQWVSLLLGSLIFGSFHLHHRNAQLTHILTWDWKYGFVATIAGVFYGFTYRKTKSLLFPAMLHTLVDVINGTFFARPPL